MHLVRGSGGRLQIKRCLVAPWPPGPPLPSDRIKTLLLDSHSATGERAQPLPLQHKEITLLRKLSPGAIFFSLSWSTRGSLVVGLEDPS